MSVHIVDESSGFINDEEKLKTLIKTEFNPERKCTYEALALKLEFNKVIVKIRQLMVEYRDQEFPDIYEHLRMMKAVTESFQDWMMMNVGSIAGQGVYYAGTPRAKSTPTQRQTNIPHIQIHSPTAPNVVGEVINQNGINRTFDGNQNNFLTPPGRTNQVGFSTPVRGHERTYNAVRNFEHTINQLQIPHLHPNSSRTRSSSRKAPSYRVSQLRFPRRRMTFSQSYGLRTPQTK